MCVGSASFASATIMVSSSRAGAISSTVAHQFGGLFAGFLAGDAGFDAEQRVGVVFALVETGLADCGGFLCVVGGH